MVWYVLPPPKWLTICRRTCGPQYIDRYDTFLWSTNCLGLTPAMFVDETNDALDPQQFTILDELESSPDPDAGLYIRARSGKIVKVAIPKHCLAFQTGEGLSRGNTIDLCSVGNSNWWKVESSSASRER